MDSETKAKYTNFYCTSLHYDMVECFNVVPQAVVSMEMYWRM